MEEPLQRIRSTADYQFGKEIGIKLFPDSVKIIFSRNTGRIRHVCLDGERLATLRPTDGFFSLSIEGAKRLTKNTRLAKCFVSVRSDVVKFIGEGGDVFAAHIVEACDDIRSKDEVVVLDENGKVLAVGRAVLSGKEMRVFKRGVAVKVRHGKMEG